jgi:hypothetical protein
LYDFDFQYSHENPFPVNQQNTNALNNAFQTVFSQAADFLG